MKRITLNIPDNKYEFFLELVKNLGLEKVKEEPVEASQEALGIEEDEYVVPEWQKEIVRERVKNTRPDEYLSWEEVRQQLKFD